MKKIIIKQEYVHSSESRFEPLNSYAAKLKIEPMLLTALLDAANKKNGTYTIESVNDVFSVYQINGNYCVSSLNADDVEIPLYKHRETILKPLSMILKENIKYIMSGDPGDLFFCLMAWLFFAIPLLMLFASICIGASAFFISKSIELFR